MITLLINMKPDVSRVLDHVPFKGIPECQVLCKKGGRVNL